jgi:hypothetical protein
MRIPRKLALALLLAAAAAIAAVGTAGASSKHTGKTAGYGSKQAFCSAVSSGKLQVSAGARGACFGSQPNGPGSPAPSAASPLGPSPFTTNHDAATPSEDITNGTKAYGQSETAIAGYNQYGVEGWNDATGFFAPVCAPSYKDQLTGIGFSTNHGSSWSDLGGLANTTCGTGSKWSGDPAVQPYHAPNGTTYFYVASLITGGSCSFLCVGIEQTHVSGGSLVQSGSPILLCDAGCGGFNIEDKEFMAIDAARHRLYITYTDFAANPNGLIELAVCDLTSPASPTCYAPYMTVDASTGCNELEGAYPAVDPKTGDVYVAYENNWATNLFGCTLPVQESLRYIAFSCLTLPAASCGGPTKGTDWPITAMDASFIPGYNRFPANDFPRIAVTNGGGGLGAGAKVAVVWNDAGLNPNGDIVMRTFTGVTLGTGCCVTQINDDSGGALHYLPAISTDAKGNFDITWFDRRNGGPNSDLTDVYASLGVTPGGVVQPNMKVTTVGSHWSAASSDIIPNFGDYTDNYIAVNDNGPTAHRVWVAWSDGRTGVPQPENATLSSIAVP